MLCTITSHGPIMCKNFQCHHSAHEKLSPEGLSKLSKVTQLLFTEAGRCTLNLYAVYEERLFFFFLSPEEVMFNLTFKEQVEINPRRGE